MEETPVTEDKDLNLESRETFADPTTGDEVPLSAQQNVSSDEDVGNDVNINGALTGDNQEHNGSSANSAEEWGYLKESTLLRCIPTNL